MLITEMVERFQCPGCVCGYRTTCGSYAYSEEHLLCTGHILGTMSGLGNTFALGLPKGFCRPGFGCEEPARARKRMDIRLWPAPTSPAWGLLNVPVWAMAEDGFLFVRTFAPRVNQSWVDVIENGTLAMTPNAIDVGQFIGDID